MMPTETKKQGFGVLGVGAAACAACCAPPIIGVLAAASLGTLLGVALFGLVGLSVLVSVAIAYLRRRNEHRDAAKAAVPITLGDKPHA